MGGPQARVASQDIILDVTQGVQAIVQPFGAAGKNLRAIAPALDASVVPDATRYARRTEAIDSANWFAPNLLNMKKFLGDRRT